MSVFCVTVFLDRRRHFFRILSGCVNINAEQIMNECASEFDDFDEEEFQDVKVEETPQEGGVIRKAKKISGSKAAPAEAVIEAPLEVQIEEPEEVSAPAPASPRRRGRTPKMPLSPKQKWIASVLKAADIEVMPSAKVLFRASGKPMRIRDIGIFAENEQHEDDLLGQLAQECPIRNEVNVEAPVNFRRVKAVGVDIFHVGWLTSGIEVAEIEEDGSIQCISGRHRLAFLGLVYGPDTEVVVTRYHYNLSDARIACTYANQSRPIKIMEKAAFMVMQATDGQKVERDERYRRVATTKGNVANYCVYETLVSSNPLATVDFPVSRVGGRIKDGSLTTVTNLKGFWSNALPWDAKMLREEFEDQLVKNVTFLNLLVDTMRKQPSFDPTQHLAAMPLRAMGRYYRTISDVGASPITQAEKISQVIVSFGDVGRDKSDETYNRIVKAMRDSASE